MRWQTSSPEVIEFANVLGFRIGKHRTLALRMNFELDEPETIRI